MAVLSSNDLYNLHFVCDGTSGTFDTLLLKAVIKSDLLMTLFWVLHSVNKSVESNWNDCFVDAEIKLAF